MRIASTILGVVCCALVGCGHGSEQKITTTVETEFMELKPPSVVVSGRWRATWSDPTAQFSEEFSMDLRQDGNHVEGTAAFVDSRQTKATVSGQVSTSEIRLVMKPDTTALHETSWTGTVTSNSVVGTWRLHGKPPSGMATAGPWNGTIDRK